jgi:hypothetical protein
MTTEQLKELGEAMSILSTKSSVLKERDELRALMEENLQAEEVLVALVSRSAYLTMCPGSEIALWRSDEAHPFHAYKN